MLRRRTISVANGEQRTQITALPRPSRSKMTRLGHARLKILQRNFPISLVGRPRKCAQIRDLIRRMSMANPLWGAPRIHGELLKLGIAVCQATVGRHMPWRPGDVIAAANRAGSPCGATGLRLWA